MAEDLLVGYRERDPIRAQLNMDTKYAGRCYSCGQPVHITPSGFDIMRRDDCDPILICTFCDHRYPGEWERVLATG